MSGPFLKVRVNPAICQGHGECVRVAPEIFRLDKNLTAHCHPRQPISLLEELRHAESACPAGAITVKEQAE